MGYITIEVSADAAKCSVGCGSLIFDVGPKILLQLSLLGILPPFRKSKAVELTDRLVSFSCTHATSLVCHEGLHWQMLPMSHLDFCFYLVVAQLQLCKTFCDDDEF